MKPDGDKLPLVDDASARLPTEGHDGLHRAKRDFLSGMSHTLKTPLNAILGFSELGERQASDPAIEMYFKNIRSAGTQLLNLLTDLLDFSRAQQGEYVPAISWFELPDFLDETVGGHKAVSRAKSLYISLDTKQADVCVESDPTVLRRVLNRLLANAIQFTPANKSIKVAASVSEVGQEQQAMLRLVVEDEGTGIPPSIQEHLFEGLGPGQLSHAKGPGLGLALAKALLGTLQATIRVVETSPSGTIFQVDIPVRARPVGSGSATTQSGSGTRAPSLRGKTIMVADDVEMNRNMVSAMLEETEASIVLAVDGQDAIEKASASEVDAVLLDIEMPSLNGWQAAEKLRAFENDSGKKYVLIALSGHNLSTDPRSAIFDALLEKPLESKTLMTCLSSLSDQSDQHGNNDVVSESSDSATSSDDTALTEDARAALIDLLQGLIPQVDQLRANQSVTLIEAFGYHVAEEAQAMSYPRLKDWGEQLAREASLFDIDAMNTSLASYESFIDRLTERRHGS
ncbi:MAG: ATP-binding protein [Bacteroidota bacterium]|nr:ATP-binding protein [Bacteroidota bacterium]